MDTRPFFRPCARIKGAWVKVQESEFGTFEFWRSPISSTSLPPAEGGREGVAKEEIKANHSTVPFHRIQTPVKIDQTMTW